MEQLIFFVSNVEIFGYYYKSNNSPVPSGDAIDNVDIKLVSLPIVMYQPFKLQYIHIYEFPRLFLILTFPSIYLVINLIRDLIKDKSISLW